MRSKFFRFVQNSRYAIALLCLLAGLGAVLFGRVPAAPLLADTEGRIESVALVVNSARSSTLRNTELTNHIVNALPAHTRVLILAPDREAFEVASNPWPDRISFADIPQNFDFTMWPQDPFLVIGRGDKARLLVSNTFERVEDREIAAVIAHARGLPAAMSGLSFEGGNIVSDPQFVFIGANTIRFNALQTNQTDQSVAKQFQRELGKPVIVIGPLPQPIGHIDMMLTPLGGKHLLLADPEWGARLAQAELDNNPAAVAAFEAMCMEQFFGDQSIRQVIVDGDTPYRPPELAGETARAIADSRTIAPQLDRLGEQLEAMGFTVSRIPYLQQQPLVAPAPEGLPEVDRPAPGYPQITYNNVLLEQYQDAESGQTMRVVYLPQYGWAQFDSIAAATWRELGYTVKPVPGFAVSAMYGGALRCAVKVLSRH